MDIRRARKSDIPQIEELLLQVLNVHAQGRPDLFVPNTRKYTSAELEEIIGDERRPVFVAVEGELVVGYAFCVYQQHVNSNNMTDVRTLYIDDLCVREGYRGKHIGSTLYNYVIDFARGQGFYNVTLNVWSCNPSAQSFYEKMGLVPYKVGMEKIL
ncbi:GNAT family N-acetyltransferase [Parafannyhessea umbonata]|uniref:Ribosomal protein S18 acetylase RimI n=1 Tax=Parafannyhessea umbonata TaxID=604330 RepID=A0A1H9N4B0_9ACTN|nr:GNAT family N-acetyltransferase [Parafannyhessea umbonata]SER30880.1 Ribosomal protein S18 acetylase RimI [Parafannyhessea umbonata]